MEEYLVSEELPNSKLYFIYSDDQDLCKEKTHNEIVVKLIWNNESCCSVTEFREQKF